MNANDVLKLIDAGFTADEIRKMDGATAPSVSHIGSSQPEQKAESSDSAPAAPVKEEDPKEEKKDDPIDAALADAFDKRLDAVVSKYDAAIDKLAKLAGMPSMEDVKPKGIEDIISNFFKEE